MNGFGRRTAHPGGKVGKAGKTLATHKAKEH